MHSRKTIVYAIIAALVGILATAALLTINDIQLASNDTQPAVNRAQGVTTQSANSASTASGAQSAAPEAGWPRTVTDSRGDAQLLQQRPRRIVSLAPSATQILRAIGADDSLIAIPREGSDPYEAADLVRLQVYPAPSPEAILALNPDLLVGADITSPAVATRLRSLGLPLVILSGNDYQGILEDVARAGEATGNEATAAIISQMLANQLEAVRSEVARTQTAATQAATTTDKNATEQATATQATAETEKASTEQATARHTARPQVLLFVGETPDYAAGRGSYAADLLDIAGGDNIALRLNNPWPQLSREFILEANPQALIFTLNAAAMTSAPDQPGRAEPLTAYLRSHPVWSQLDAVRSNRVYVIDQNLLSVPGPQVGEALAQLRSIIRDAQRLADSN